MALGYFYGGKNLKSQKNFLEKFSDTPKLLELSQVSQFSKWLTTDLVDNVKDKIKKSNYKKVTILLTETNDEVHRIYKSYSDFESSIMKLATSPCSKIFVSLSLSKPVISFDNRLEAVRLSCQG